MRLNRWRLPQSGLVIGHGRSLTKGLGTVNYSSFLHPYDLGRATALGLEAYTGTSVTIQGETSSVMEANFRAVLLAGVPGKMAPRLMRTYRK